MHPKHRVSEQKQ